MIGGQSNVNKFYLFVFRNVEVYVKTYKEFFMCINYMMTWQYKKNQWCDFFKKFVKTKKPYKYNEIFISN